MFGDSTCRRREPKLKFCTDQPGIIRLWARKLDSIARVWLKDLLRILTGDFLQLSDTGHVQDKVINKNALSKGPSMPPYLNQYHIGTDLSRDGSAHDCSIISQQRVWRAPLEPFKGSFSNRWQSILESKSFGGSNPAMRTIQGKACSTDRALNCIM